MLVGGFVLLCRWLREAGVRCLSQFRLQDRGGTAQGSTDNGSGAVGSSELSPSQSGGVTPESAIGHRGSGLGVGVGACMLLQTLRCQGVR